MAPKVKNLFARRRAFEEDRKCTKGVDTGIFGSSDFGQIFVGFSDFAIKIAGFSDAVCKDGFGLFFEIESGFGFLGFLRKGDEIALCIGC